MGDAKAERKDAEVGCVLELFRLWNTDGSGCVLAVERVPLRRTGTKRWVFTIFRDLIR